MLRFILPLFLLLTVPALSTNAQDVVSSRNELTIAKAKAVRGFAPSATLTVTKTADTNDGVCNTDCSLREAVAAATAGDTIVFASPLFDTAQSININGQINLTKNLTINGRGPALTTIRNIAPQSTTSRVLVNVGNVVNLSGLTIAGANAIATDFTNTCGAMCGGGIYNSGTLTITNSVIAENTATGTNSNQALGGGIFNFGTLVLTNCTVRGNAVGGINGSNRGGGIYQLGGSMTLIGSTISGNSVATGSLNQGGGVAVQGGTMTAVNSTFSGNSGSGGTGNEGGGIFISNAVVDVINSTLSGNTVGSGVVSRGGGISVLSGTLNVRNSIVSGNSAIGSGADISGSMATNDSNIIGNEALVKLAPLGNYGGPTQTHALLAGSSAINAGNNCVLTVNGCGGNNPAAVTDQRGKARAGQVDIGAFEAAGLTVTKTADTNDGVCDADCSLREAIAAAQSGDTISFISPLFDTPQTIQTNGQLVIDKTVIINGRGANLTTIRNVAAASDTSRVFFIDGAVTVNLSGLTITGANAVSDGGGIFNNGGTLNLLNNTVSGNSASGGGGGVISTGGAVNLVSTTVTGNSGDLGGGIFLLTGALNLINSTLSGNSANAGGGIAISGGTVSLTNSTVSGNSATLNYGGLANFGGTYRARNTVISGNTANFGPEMNGALAVNENNLIGGVSLAPLGFYGGQTRTHALLSNATNAINTGNNCVLTRTCATFNAPDFLTTDQRGAARVGNVDIGAFEANSGANGGSFRAVLPDGRTNSSYNFTLVPSNGSTTYAVTGGALPNGMSLTSALAPNAVVALAGTPTNGGVFNFSITATNGAATSVTDYTLNVLVPTAAGVTVSGRVATGDGRGLANAIVVLTDASGASRSVRTGTFGFFRFDDVAAGQTYVVEVVSKRFSFAPQVVYVGDNVGDLEFVGADR